MVSLTTPVFDFKLCVASLDTFSTRESSPNNPAYMLQDIHLEWYLESSIAPGIIAMSLGALIVWIYHFSVKGARRRYPPGPPGNLLFGNILGVPPEGAWLKFTEEKGVYGDLVFFHGLGNHILVLNCLQDIHELFEKRGTIYSDRPSFTVVSELMELGQSMPLLSYGEEWKAHRRLAHVALSVSAVKRYHPVQEDLAALLCHALIESPEDFFGHVRLTASRLILTITYGLSVNTADSEYITHAEDTIHIISKATVPGAFLCDLIPRMKYLPSWMPFHRYARKGKMMIEWLVNKPFDQVIREMGAGIAPPSLTHDLLSKEGADSPILRRQIKWTAGALYGAGGETTYATVLTCIMAMALHPEKLRKTQAELDRVVGTERMPRIDDRASLSYVDAVIKETMRWHPALPLGIARSTACDDVYEGFSIPKGTIVIPNVWAIAFAPQGPHDPYAFVPERFLAVEAEDMPTDPAVWAFGFARRACPGRYLAENSVFILIATILAMFDIGVPDGVELSPTFTKGLVSYPEPFECTITVRSDSRLAQIRARVEQCAV